MFLDQTNINSNIGAITEEHLNSVNVEEPFNMNKMTIRNSDTIDETLMSINVDKNSADSTLTADTNLHRNIVEPSPIVLFRDSDIKQITKQLYELIKSQTTSGTTSSSDQNQCDNTTTVPQIKYSAEKQMLSKDLQLMVQEFYKFSHSERRKIVDFLSDLPAESTEQSRVDDQNLVPETLSISEERPGNLTEKNKTGKTEKITQVCFDTTEYAMQIAEDKSRLENDYSIKSIETCSDTQNSTSQSSKITAKNKIIKKKILPRNKIPTLKKTVEAKQKSEKTDCQHKNVKKKTMLSHTKRKTIGTLSLKNDLQRKPRLEKNTNDSASEPVGTVKKDKNISNCDKMTNNESTSKPSIGSAKLEDIVKNSRKEHPLEELNPVTKSHSEDEINDNESSEVTISNIPEGKQRQKGMREEIKQILVYIDKKILTVDPENGMSINPNRPKTSHDSSQFNTSQGNLVNSEKQSDAMIQFESDKAFNEIPDHLSMNKNNPDSALPAEVKIATAPCKPKSCTSQNQHQSKKTKQVNSIQKSPTVEECNIANEKSVWQLKELKVLCERYPFKKDDKNHTTVQEEHCDSTTAVTENRPNISSLVETCISQATVACNTDAEYFKSFPIFYAEPSEAERQIINDYQSKTPLQSNDDVEMNLDNTESCVCDNEIHNANKETICVGDNSTTKDDEKEILNGNYR